MQIEPYLSFDGTCEEAFNFYAEVFGGKIEYIQKVAGTPAEDHMGPGMGDKILHALLRVGDTAVMASDSPGGSYEQPSGTWISVAVDDVAEADRVWARLAEGGGVVMPIDTTFWAERFGMVKDRFGTPWMINCQGNVEPPGAAGQPA